MGMTDTILVKTFELPRGPLGRLGGRLMARNSEETAHWVIGDVLRIAPDDAVIDVGFGPGVAIKLAAQRAHRGFVAGVDPSLRMIEQATQRNVEAIRAGRVQLRYGTADYLRFGDDTFDHAVAMNSLHLWPDPLAGLRELRRVLKPQGVIVVSQPEQTSVNLNALLTEAGFAHTHLIESRLGVCAIAGQPSSVSLPAVRLPRHEPAAAWSFQTRTL